MKTTITLAMLALVLSMPGAAAAKGPKHCPPGLAKKDPACAPPGQAKKGVRYEDELDRHDEHARDDDLWQDDRFDRIRVGDRVILNGDDYTVVRAEDGRIVLRRDDTLYRLPHAGDSSDYVRMGDVIVRVDPETKRIVDWIRLTDLILG